MLINFSNHPSTQWTELQLKAAEKYGHVLDFPFPFVDPMAEPYQIEILAETYEIKLRHVLASENTGLSAIHIMGELNFCFALVDRLQKAGITCLASITQRSSTGHSDGSKTSRFRFVRFREYV